MKENTTTAKVATGKKQHHIEKQEKQFKIWHVFAAFLSLPRVLGQPAGCERILTFAPQGLRKTNLMGELGNLLALPVYQLALPFTHEAWRQLEYTRAFLLRASSRLDRRKTEHIASFFSTRTCYRFLLHFDSRRE